MSSAQESVHVIGIDLGTTNSCLATLDEGQAMVVANAEGERTTPSVVAIVEDAQRIVGTAARRQGIIHPERTVASVKRLIGRRVDELDGSLQTSYRVGAGENGAARIEVDEQSFSPEEISSLILAKLKTDAEAFIGEPITKAVITVPAYFNDAQRQATKDAGKIAGLEVLRLINEPTAAALAYGFSDEREQTLLVFDLGGGTFDVSVLEIGDGVFDVKSTAGDNQLGGDDFDHAIATWIIEDFRLSRGIDLELDPATVHRLHEAAEQAKVELSVMPTTRISLPFISTNSDGGPEHLDIELSRSQMNALTMPLLDRLVEPTRRALTAAKVDPEAIDHIILVGGMTRMPAVQERVSELAGKPPHKGVNPDEAVAMGAAIQAGIIEGQIDDVLLLDVNPIALGIETAGGVMTPLIAANATLPVKKIEVFTTAVDNQPSVEVHILQGERELAGDNRTLGRVKLLGVPPAIAGVPQIQVIFDLDANGILSVSASDLGTGNHQQLVIESATKLEDEEIGRIRAEAEIHRHEDRRRRQQIELENDVQTALQQAEGLLERHAEQLSDEERVQLAEAGEMLRQQLADPDSGEIALDQTLRALSEKMQAFTRRLYASPAGPESVSQSPVIEPTIDAPISVGSLGTVTDDGDESEIELVDDQA